MFAIMDRIISRIRRLFDTTLLILLVLLILVLMHLFSISLQSQCNLVSNLCCLNAISSLIPSRLNAISFSMQSRSQCYLVSQCNLVFNAIFRQSLSISMQSLCEFYAISLQCYMILSAIPLQSLRNLFNLHAIFVQFLELPSCKSTYGLNSMQKIGKWKDWSEIGWIDPRWGPSVGNFCRTARLELWINEIALVS